MTATSGSAIPQVLSITATEATGGSEIPADPRCCQSVVMMTSCDHVVAGDNDNEDGVVRWLPHWASISGMAWRAAFSSTMAQRFA